MKISKNSIGVIEKYAYTVDKKEPKVRELIEKHFLVGLIKLGSCRKKRNMKALKRLGFEF